MGSSLITRPWVPWDFERENGGGAELSGRRREIRKGRDEDGVPTITAARTASNTNSSTPTSSSFRRALSQPTRPAPSALAPSAAPGPGPPGPDLGPRALPCCRGSTLKAWLRLDGEREALGQRRPCCRCRAWRVVFCLNGFRKIW